ncbi:hypothetical protein DKM44_02180 [Deinococcus irradiatisoli]|uniref:Uncharacterized protein n=1 Tax=Deinococcus irradiatisoli TaxID=2202254 RepID=A0A2Z3JAQ3_9DEIO|nr:hypothetical protein [Deinococcus irradiatisoli]AWN22187.1 hypothetical protein DKM44_02180 [Deinococcus irradiatisoli]
MTQLLTEGLDRQQPAERTHICMSCYGTFTVSRAAHACHGGSACPFDEPDNWESYEPDDREWKARGTR